MREDETELLILLASLNARAPLYDAPPVTYEELAALAAIEWEDEESA
jgi:hypothetical protein